MSSGGAAHTRSIPREIAFLWRSNRRLFELLDAALTSAPGQPTTAFSSEQLSKLLEHMHDTLLNLLDDYGATANKSTPAAAAASSSSAATATTVTWRGKAHSVDAHSAAFLHRLSETMSVDLSVAFGVWHVFLRDEFVASAIEYDDALLAEVVRVFFDERRCVIYIVAALVRAAADDQSPMQRVADEAIERLVRAGLPDRIIAQYVHLAEHKLAPPMLLAPLAVQRLAAKQHVHEQVALLELLFLVHYDKVVCPPARFLKLARLFQLHEFGAQQPNAALLDAEARAATQRVGATAALVLVETLSLESLLDDSIAQNVVANSLVLAARGQPDTHLLRAFDAELLHAPPLAPLSLVQLAWACVLVRVNNELGDAPGYAWQAHAARALGADDGESGALKYALAALCGDEYSAPPLLEIDSPNLLAYNSVLKGLLSATLFAFDVAGLVAQGDIVRLHCVLHAGQVEIVRQFWQRDVQYPQLAAVLELTRARFPLEVAPFLSVLTSLAADADTATYVCTQYMTNQTTFCAPLLAEQRDAVSRIAEVRLPPTPSSVSPMQSVRYTSAAGEAMQQQQRLQAAAALDRVRFRAERRLPLTLAPFGIATDIVVDAGSDGEASRGTRFAVLGGGAAVRWRVNYCGWRVCFALLRDTAASAHSVSDAQLESATAVLDLLATLIERRPDDKLAAFLLDRNPALLQQTTALLWLAAGILGSPTAAVTVARQRVLLALARAATAVLLALSVRRCAAVWSAWFAADSARSIESGRMLRAERSGALQIDALRVLITAERSRAHFAFTPVLLDLLLAFLRFAQRWPSQTVIPVRATEQLAPFMSFVRIELFATQSAWRYRSAPQRWLLGAKVLALFDAALADAEAELRPLPLTVVDVDGAVVVPEIKRRRKRGDGDDDGGLADALTQALLHDATFHTALLEIVRMGYRPLSRLVAERRAQAAQQLESLIALSLVVLRRVLLAAPPGVTTALHRALLAVQATVYDAALIIEKASVADVDDVDELQGGTAASNAVAVLFGYVRPGPLYRRVAVSAAQSLSALIAGDVGTGALPPLLGYLAGSSRQCRESFVDTLRTDWAPLQCALLDLCSLALVAQPNVASWLLGEMAPLGVAPGAASSSSTASTATAAAAATTAAAASNTAAAAAAAASLQRSNVCAVINSWLERVESLAERRPAVLAAAMRLLRVLWTRAPQHSVAAGLLRGNAAFWPSLILIVGKDAVSVERHFPPHVSGGGAATRPEVAQAHDDGLRAQLLSARASVFGVIAWEALYVARDKLDAPLMQALQPVSTRRALLTWLINYARCSFDQDLLSTLSAQVRKLGISLDSVRRVRAPDEVPGAPKIVYTFGNGADGDRGGNPSTSYMYDIDRLSRHLADSDVPREPAAELVQTAVRTNACLALCDAQLDLLQMWCAFVRTLRARHPNALLPPGRAQSVGTQSHDGVLDLCRACAVWLEKETRESTVLDLFATEMTNLMLALLTGWLAQSPALPAACAPAVAALAGSLSRLSRRSSDASALLMASTPAASESSAPVPPQLAGRHTLLSTLACATRCVVSADDAALADDAFHTACVALVTPACELLERALQADDYCVALSCVQLSSALCNRVRSTNASHFGAVLVFVEFARRELEARLLALLARLLEQATLPALASAVLELMRVVCERDRDTAERLFVAGALKLLAPARVPRGLRDGYEPYRLSISAAVGGAASNDNVRVVGERNEWHGVWCEALRLVAALCSVPSLSVREAFSRQLQQFILVHRVSAATCISMSPARFDVGGDAAASAPSNVVASAKESVVGNKENDEPRNASRRDPWSVGASTSGRRDEALFVDAPTASTAVAVAEDMATDDSKAAVGADEMRRYQVAYDAENARTGEAELTLARLDEAACWLAVLVRAASHFAQWINLVGDDARPVPLLMHVLLLVNEFALHLNAPQRLAGLARALSREERHMTTRAALRDQQRRDDVDGDAEAPVLKGILKGVRDGVGGANAQQLTWDEQIAARGTFAYALTAKMRDALLVALAVVRSVGPGLVPDDRRAAEGLHANDAIALSRVLFVPEMEIEHHPSAGVSIGALVSAANVGVSDLKALAPTARSKVSAPLVQAAVELATSALYLALAHLRAHVALADATRLTVLRDEFGSELTGLIERIQRAFDKLGAGVVSKGDTEFVRGSQRFVSVILMMPSN